MKPLEAKFPYPKHIARLQEYQTNTQLLEGSHYNAFTIKAEEGFTQRYAQLRYVVCNFAGLISKVIADILFGDEVQLVSARNQDWLEALVFKNQLKVQNYESAMSNSARGDAIYKIRVEENEIYINDINPSIYFPHLDSSNLRKKFGTEELAWTEEIGKTKFLVREIYRPGYVTTEVNEMDGKGNVDIAVPVENYNKIAGTKYIDSVETGIKKNLLVHIPNYRYSGKYFGVSDYTDINSLLFALNNRVTKIDNILDKHSDPILAVPEGVLDEDGKVKKEAFKMIEVTKEGGKPEYIVWNASLENAFKEIDKLVEFLYMFSETSPDVLGIGKGQAESGRALKIRLLRTLAKRNRKRLYYDQGLKEVLLVAQELSRAKGFTVNGKKASEEPAIPQIRWSEGIVEDKVEATEIETTKLTAGLSSRKRSIMRLEGIEEKTADEIIKEIDIEKLGGVEKPEGI